MVNLSVFLPRLLPNVLGCSEPLALQALLDSAIEFCTRSCAVSVMLDPVTTVKNIPTYEIETPAQTGVGTVLDVWYEGRLLSPIPFNQATSLFNNSPGQPRYYFGEYVDEVYSLTMLPTPEKTSANALRIRVALTPNRTATQVHDVLFERYAEGVVAGAIQILAAIPDQSFTNLPLAASSAIRARTEANLARSEIMHGNVQSSMSVKMRAF